MSTVQADLKETDGSANQSSNIAGNNIGELSFSKRLINMSKLIMRDVNANKYTPAFYKYTKDEIAKYLKNPSQYEKQLRDAVIYIYGASPHFRRLIKYFAGLTDLSYVISPVGIDPKKTNVRNTKSSYKKVSKVVSSMNIKTQLPRIITVCLREDVFYGTMWVSEDDIIIQRLPSDFCTITTIEGGVANVTFNFRYFDSRKDLLEFYPAEFSAKYAMYQKDTRRSWIELDSPTSFAIKCNDESWDYAIPPFAGLLREVYDIEDYKDLKLTKTALENYALLLMKLPMNSDGEWLIDYKKARNFWENLDEVLPEEVGSVLSPMDITKIGFEKSNTGDTNTISEAEQNLFTAAGVSSLLFNNEKASANALALSIKADQAITYGIVKSIESVINRYIRSLPYGQKFKVTFLDVSAYNRKEAGDAYLKACQYGIPMVSYYCASQGLSQSEMDCMNFLENEILDIKNTFIPLQSSATQSKDSNAATEEGGAPRKDETDLSDSGEQTREDGDDW